jgi:hypothetical protein
MPGAELARVEAPSTSVEITSLLGASSAAGAPADIRDIKEAVPVRAPGYAPWKIACAAACAALLAAGVWLYLARGRRPLVAPARPAHDLAIEELERLRSERFIERGQYDAYYVRLSALIRRYVERRFGLRAPEMTTDEFLAAAQRGRELASPHRIALQEFLSEADLVKFARHVPSRDRAERAWTAARDLVEATRPRQEVGSAAA